MAFTIGSGLLATMFAYDGWIHVGNVAGELKTKRDFTISYFSRYRLYYGSLFINKCNILLTLPIESLAGNLNAASDTSKYYLVNMAVKLLQLVS